MMARGGEVGGVINKQNFDDVLCERSLRQLAFLLLGVSNYIPKSKMAAFTKSTRTDRLMTKLTSYSVIAQVISQRSFGCSFAIK